LVCDVCGDRIAAKDGYVVWKTTDDLKSSGFKIIHQGRCDRRDYPASAALSDFLGPEGVAQLLAFLSLGPIKRRIGQTMKKRGVFFTHRKCSTITTTATK
jgi:hypothetical protein